MGPDYQGDRGGSSTLGRAYVVGCVGQGRTCGGGEEEGGPGQVGDWAGGRGKEGEELEVWAKR